MNSENSIQQAPHNSDTNPQFSKEYQEQHIRPWMRFFAKYIDLYVFASLIGLIVGIALPTFSQSLSSIDQNGIEIVGVLALLFWFLLEPLFLCSWGTTLGRFLLNIKLTDLNGNKLKIFDAYKRSLRVWALGLGCGVKIASLVALIISWKKLKKTGTTYWDKNKFTVTHKKVGTVKRIVAALILISIFIFFINKATQIVSNFHSQDYGVKTELENKQ